MSFELTEKEKRELRKCKIDDEECECNCKGYCIDEDYAVSGLCPMESIIEF